MRVWIEDALDLLGREPRLALVSVVEAAGSAPR
jgi:xanthine/CO dehydrogenase XdhC/CoxF family maturation factor